MFTAAFFVVYVGAANAQDSTDSEYTVEKRIDTISKGLAAVKQLDPNTQNNLISYIHNMAKTACRGNSASLQANCLIEAGRRNCRQMRKTLTDGACNLATDVIIVNRLSESQFLSSREKYRVARKAKKARIAIENAIRLRHATLVTEFRLSPFFSSGEIAEKIDNFCQDGAKNRGISWQHCTAALVWFIGTSS